MGKVTGDLFTSTGLAEKERASRRVVNKVAGNVWKPNFLGVRGSSEIYSRFLSLRERQRQPRVPDLSMQLLLGN
jgi:hypothetical protein